MSGVAQLRRVIGLDIGIGPHREYGAVGAVVVHPGVIEVGEGRGLVGNLQSRRYSRGKEVADQLDCLGPAEQHPAAKSCGRQAIPRGRNVSDGRPDEL